MAKAGNRGEWGEPYVALYLLGQGRIFVSDRDGKKNPNEWMNVLEVIRHETMDRLVVYHYKSEDTMVDIEVNGNTVISIPAEEFLKASEQLANDIIKSKGRSFSVSDNVMRFIAYAEMFHLKAKSVEKSDIFLTVSDPRTSVVRQHIGFSIKTKFGHNPTLFNTAPASGTKYLVEGMTDEFMEEINSIIDDKGHVAVLERCRKLKASSCNMKFVGFPIAKRSGCEAFKENLDLIDPRLPYVIERMLWNHFFEEETSVDISQVVKRIIEENPCQLTRPEVKYPYMVKSFLYAGYCGMTASTLWDGFGQVNGGFITVGEDGEVLANYALESEEFKGYLYNNCYLEFPSTGEHHGDYAKVYKEDNNYYFNLNFQIRYR